MGHWKVLSYTQIIAHIPNSHVIELLAIIGHNRMENANPTNNILPKEFCSISLDNLSQRLSFNPFHKIINCDNSEGHTSSSFQWWTYEINSLFEKRRGTCDHGKALRWLPLDIGKLLAFIAFLHELACIPFQGWPVVFLSEYFVSQSCSSGIISTYPFLNLSQDI